MPLSPCLVLSGSQCRFLARTSPFSTPANLGRCGSFRFVAAGCFRSKLSTCTITIPILSARCSPPPTFSGHGALVRLEYTPASLFQRRQYWKDIWAHEQSQNVETDEENEVFEGMEKIEESTSAYSSTSNFPRHLQLSRSKLKARRQGRPQLVIDAIQGPAAACYTQNVFSKNNLSHVNLRQISPRNPAQCKIFVQSSRENLPLSLYTVLARYVQAVCMPSLGESEFRFTEAELHVLQSKGYTGEHVKRWATSLLEPSPFISAQLFQDTEPTPPMFLVLIFLRRRTISTYALSIIMQHLDDRLRHGGIDWNVLKILIIRLTRQARKVWPESMPRISSLFTTEARRLFHNSVATKSAYSKLGADVDRFCNAFIKLLSLPASLNPMLSSRFQEKAQFGILKFMADSSPPIAVTRTGFRALSRVQLAHTKTSQEQEWARLKGTSWPPWKQSQTAMDEGKGYQYGASRASTILHRMFEAGYPQGKFETMVELYAGWDVDLSPTIQTRTLLPQISTYKRDSERLQSLIWAARVRATRTRREAWACFVAYEASKAPASQDVYQAMFEKLYFSVYAESSLRMKAHQVTSKANIDTSILPGDMREVIPEPSSPLGLVYISEPVPTMDQLYHRMTGRGLQPTGRVLAFMINTTSNFSSGLDMLRSAESEFHHLASLLDGSILGRPADDQLGLSLPTYLLTAFIRLLCRFGHFSHMPHAKPMTIVSTNHLDQLRTDPHYRLEYALGLLLHLLPRYGPAWTAYMEILVHFPCERHILGQKSITSQHTIMCVILEKMHQVGIQLDQEQFQIVCTILRYTAQAAISNQLSTWEANHILSSESRRLRSLFNTLVKGHLGNLYQTSPNDPQSDKRLPPQIPRPWTIHAYVRALGTFRDFEGLYSLSTWATNHVAEITEVAKAQRSGPQAWRKTLVALRVALEGKLDDNLSAGPASVELVELTKAQIDGVEEWGGWPTDEEVEVYRENS